MQIRRLRFVTIYFLSLTMSLACRATATQTKYFPPHAFSPDQRLNEFVVGWYSRQLEALQEPSLLQQPTESTQSYRFLWLRTFHHPVVVRVNIHKDGTGDLITKMGSGAGGYGPGTLTLNRTAPLDKARVDAFLELVVREDFWKEPTSPNQQTGTDGSEWVIEGTRPGQYHVIDRWSPSRGVAYELGKKLAIDLAGLDIPAKEFY